MFCSLNCSRIELVDFLDRTDEKITIETEYVNNGI